MFWIWRIGIVFSPFTASTFARGENTYGPYKLWFERIWWPIYWAVTPPYKFVGWRWSI